MHDRPVTPFDLGLVGVTCLAFTGLSNFVPEVVAVPPLLGFWLGLLVSKRVAQEKLSA